MNLLHNWPLDGDTSNAVGNIVADDSGLNLTYPAGLLGQAAQFEIELNSALAFIPPGATPVAFSPPYSFWFWFSPQNWDYPQSSGMIAQFAGGGSGFYLYSQKSGQRFWLNPFNDAATLSEFEEITAHVTMNAWNLCLIAAEVGRTRCYINTQEVLNVAKPLVLNFNTPADSHFGDYADTYPSDFLLDDIALVDEALTASQVTELHNFGNGTTAAAFAGGASADWTASLDPLTTRIYYALDLDDGVNPVVRIPISSWQTTLQLDRSSFGQVVIPAATQWLDPIDALTNPEFSIKRGVLFDDGTTDEVEMARFPLQLLRLSEGPTNTTVILSGYTTLAAPAPLTRTLEGVRSIGNDPRLRVRSSIDWRLRPGHTAIVRGTSFTVGYINYYVNVDDEYMDVGQAAA